jgi:hypothetical protein
MNGDGWNVHMYLNHYAKLAFCLSRSRKEDSKLIDPWLRKKKKKLCQHHHFLLDEVFLVHLHHPQIGAKECEKRNCMLVMPSFFFVETTFLLSP